MSTAARRTRLPRAERVRQVLAAAARAFARSGYAATSMEDIAAEAGISKLMLYRDFDGKRELYKAVLEGLESRLAELVGDDPEGGASVRGLAALVGVAREQPDAFVLLFRHAAREPAFAAYADRFLDASVARAEERLARELADPVLVRWSARVAVHATIEAVIAWLQVGDPARDDAFLAALGATPLTEGPLTGWPERVAAAVQQHQANTK